MLKNTKEKESSRSKIERKQKKKKFPIKDQKKTRENIHKGLQTRQYLNKHTELSQANEKRKETTTSDTRSGLLPLITNQNFMRRGLCRPALDKNRKGKGQNTQSQVSHQTQWGSTHLYAVI